MVKVLRKTLIADTCPLCGDYSKGGEFCSWCRSEAQDYLKKFELYKDSDREDLYDLLMEEAERLSFAEDKKKRMSGERKSVDMVNVARSLCGIKED